MFFRSAVILPLAALLIGLFSSTAAAKKNKHAAVCARAAERAQQLRIDGKLLSAQDELHTCMRPVCPAVIRSHCTRWFEEVESALPSVVLRVSDEAGHDLADVTVRVDGQVAESWREGLPIVLDPGEHEFIYERPAHEPHVERVLLAASEKNRVLSITLESGTAAPQYALSDEPGPLPEQTGHPVPDERAERARGKPSAGAWVMGSAALAAWGSFAYFGITGQSKIQDLRDTCAGECAQSEVNKTWTRLIIADVSLGVAVVATGVATWLFVASARKNREHEGRRSTNVGMAPARHGGFVHLSTRF